MELLKFSIIIPHKNSFDLLLRLLSTLPDNGSLEVIVVDDHSVAEQVNRLKSYSFPPNVRIYYDLSGKGAGRARNIGLEQAKGKWLLFADADDYYTEDMFSMLNKYFDSPSDIVYFGTSSIYNDTGEIAYRHRPFMSLIDNYLRCVSTEDKLKYSFTPPWGKMIRKELVDTYHIRFDEVIASNDVFFSIHTAYRARQISATKDVLYVITVTSGSLVNTFSQSHFDARLKVALKANDFLRSIHKSKYQLSVLYFLGKSYNFGFKYVCQVIFLLIKHRSNLWIGINKIFKLRRVLKERENKTYLIKTENES